jgi:hypothetical protein
MCKRGRGVGEVLPIVRGLNENRRAGWMRKHFELAKLDRPRLKEESPTTMMVNFRSWRDTGVDGSGFPREFDGIVDRGNGGGFPRKFDGVVGAT